mmetsp:Transcript_103128/g.298348  ORF Transcript_103128/g.298348 Transcript_103128/m.298348 type:complete len:282 (-) Transcript_103128:525-1370(-)
MTNISAIPCCGSTKRKIARPMTKRSQCFRSTESSGQSKTSSSSSSYNLSFLAFASLRCSTSSLKLTPLIHVARPASPKQLRKQRRPLFSTRACFVATPGLERQIEGRCSSSSLSVSDEDSSESDCFSPPLSSLLSVLSPALHAVKVPPMTIVLSSGNSNLSLPDNCISALRLTIIGLPMPTLPVVRNVCLDWCSSSRFRASSIFCWKLLWASAKAVFNCSILSSCSFFSSSLTAANVSPKPMFTWAMALSLRFSSCNSLKILSWGFSLTTAAFLIFFARSA